MKEFQPSIAGLQEIEKHYSAAAGPLSDKKKIYIFFSFSHYLFK